MTAPVPSQVPHDVPDAVLPARVGRLRLDLIAHGLSLVAVLATVLIAARGQWFFYDEWDFLAERAEWALLAPHNGHLSLFPQLFTTLVKGVFGLSTYWPYLALTIAVHLVIVHLVWRLALRSGASWVFAVLFSTIFGVLAPAAENTLWAFQVGFITPLATGIVALLIVARRSLRRRDLVIVAVLLVVGVGFSGTALPMTGAVLIFMLIRHGWRQTAVPAAAFVVLYGLWYVVFNRGQSTPFGVRSGYDLIVRVPEFITHAFVDSIAKMLPMVELAPVLLVALVAGGLIGLRRSTLSTLSPAYFAALAALAFAALTALTRVQLGVEGASAGRYVYVYGALLLPAAAVAVTRLVGSSRMVGIVLVLLLGVLAVFNAGGLLREGNAQALQERRVERAISAALSIDDGSEGIGRRAPAAILAPTLTMDDIRSFVERGQFTPVPFTPSDLLDVRVNLYLEAYPESGAAPGVAECEAAVDGFVEIDPGDRVWAPLAVGATVYATDGAASTFSAKVDLKEGWNRVQGLELDTLRLLQGIGGGLCVVAD